MPSRALAGFSAWREQYRSAAYIAPFATVLLLLAALPKLGLTAYAEWPLAVAVTGLVCYLSWPAEISTVPKRWVASILVGAAVFALWIAPDLLIPGYRGSPLFSNAVMGHVGSSIRAEALRSPWVLIWRSARAVVVVPMAEELFWRGWLMRWLINNDFERVPLGTYAPVAFWITAALFAAEHGPYWDVGLLTGIIYNCWMIRVRSVADCILMHAVTNGLLSAYVIFYAQWQYWQ